MQKNNLELKNACLKKFTEIYPELTKTLLDLGEIDLLIFKGSVHSRFIVLDLKENGSQHDKEEIKERVKYGESIKANGGEYYIIKTVSAFMTVINGKGTDPGILDVWAIQELIKVSNNKTINF